MKKKKEKQNKQDQTLWTYHQTDNADNLELGHPRQNIIFKEVVKLIKLGKILEIGFGDGYLLNKLSLKYKSYGADISLNNIRQMQKRIPQAVFKLIDVDGELPYKDNFFNGFIASEVLEHMDDKELKICISEIKRILVPRGMAIITFPAEENLKSNECFCPKCENKFHKWGHKQYWNEKKIKNIFKDFEIVKVKTFFTPYKSKNILENSFGWAMWGVRTFLKKFIKIDGATYLVILRNK